MHWAMQSLLLLQKNSIHILGLRKHLRLTGWPLVIGTGILIINLFPLVGMSTGLGILLSRALLHSRQFTLFKERKRYSWKVSVLIGLIMEIFTSSRNMAQILLLTLSRSLGSILIRAKIFPPLEISTFSATARVLFCLPYLITIVYRFSWVVSSI